MPITYNLVEDNRVQLLIISEPWEIPAVLEALRALVADMDRSAKKLHIITDVRRVRHLPIALLGQIRHEMKPGHPMRGHAVVVGTSILVIEAFQFVSRYFQFDHLSIFEGEDEAWSYVRKLLAEEATNE